MKPISAVDLLKVLDGRDPGALEEKLVDIGMDEALQLLKTSFKSSTVLTDVFLGDIRGKWKDLLVFKWEKKQQRKDIKIECEPIELTE
ncbi:OLC1v1007844C2 [Oldenlandia corymbosa var. corymbosa]|nr:OLC1v1007844C2 [Oldenlandia corymbosa var. corymbosa]